MNEIKHWQVFQTYNLYRICLISILFFYKYLNVKQVELLLNEINQLYFAALSIYLLVIIFFSFKVYRQHGRFDTLVISSAFVDLLFLNQLILNSGSLDSGIGILLNVSIAALAILVPGIITLFFAAFESILMLSYGYYKFSLIGGNSIFYAGMYGAGFFATAITSLGLAHFVKLSSQAAKQKNDDLILLQNFNQYIIEKIQSGIIFVKEDGELIFINNAAKSIFNIQSTPKFLVNLSIELNELLSQNIGNFNIKNSIQNVFKTKTQLVTIMPYELGVNNSVVIILDDPKILMQQAQQLKLASLGRFTASIAHELRNPLSSISHASQLLDEHSLDQQQKRLNQIIGNNCNRMNQLIKNVLQLSRQQKSKFSKIDLNIFITEFINENASSLNVSANFQEVGNLPKILFDRSQLYQLFVILFENAAKHGKSNKQTNKLSLIINQMSKSVICLKLQDYGPGISTESIDKIFEPFFTTSRNGTGLGLFIAKELCIANQASINIIDVKQGACFEISFIGIAN